MGCYFKCCQNHIACMLLVEGPKLSEISEEEREQVKTDVQEAMEAKEDDQAEGMICLLIP